MKNITLALAIALTACTANAPTDVEPHQRMVELAIGTRVETDITPESAAAFTARMQRDVSVWNDGLVALGCEPPFAFTDDVEQQIRIVLQGGARYWAWTPPNGGGYFDGRDIYLVSDLDGTYNSVNNNPTFIIPQHELGHALGLPHNSRIDSVMSDITFAPVSPGDLDDAANAIGCVR